MKLDISQDQLYSLLVCAVRYSLGRMTYIVGETCSMVRHYAKHLDRNHLSVILRDIREQASWGEKAYGWECDEREWMGLAEFLEGEIARRGAK